MTQVHVVNAFPAGEAGGNPAGIVLDPDSRIPAKTRQAIAAKMALSETAFISRPKGRADFRVEFFTPTRQIAHCGHATIAAFNFLAQTQGLKGELVKETIESPRKILLRDGKATMEQLAPVYTGADAARAARALGLKTAEGAEVASTGNRFLLVPVASQAALASLKPDLSAIEAQSSELDLIGFYAFAPGDGEVAAYARMFAPRFGISEESATGMAAGPLACWLYDRGGQKRTALVIGQGDHMPEPSPSRIEVSLTLAGGKIAGVVVGGGAKQVKTVEVDEEKL